MLIIFSEKHSPRLSYILDFIFRETAGQDYALTNDKDSFKISDSIKINYSATALSTDEFRIEPASLLFETDLNAPRTGVFAYENTKAIFPSPKPADFPFDIFSACFYMLSRFEEYQPFIKDVHGRFKPDESLAAKNDFLHVPVVNLWIEHFFNALNRKSALQFLSVHSYRFTNTIDIDIAYSYKHKGVYRNFYGLLRSVKQGQFGEMAERIKVLSGFEKDPFDTFDYIIDIHKSRNLNTIFFVHVGDYGVYDKNIPYRNPKFRALIRHLADYAEIGIHPSYESSLKPEKVREEIERLSDIVKKDITKSRQHFLKISFPYTYRILCDNKIREDFSLGFASQAGFRAGTSTPFRFFDLDTNKATALLIRPFTIMEGTFRDYQNLNAHQATAAINKQLDTVRSCNGEFISLWHNESLSDRERWKGWRIVYETMIENALK